MEKTKDESNYKAEKAIYLRIAPGSPLHNKLKTLKTVEDIYGDFTLLQLARMKLLNTVIEELKGLKKIKLTKN